MKHKRLSNRRFCALKYNIVLQGCSVSYSRFFLCVVVLLYCLLVVVLCCLMIETRKAVSVSCVVVCKDNNKVNRCGVSVVLLWGCCGVVDGFVFGFGVVDRVRGWEVKERSRTLYPVRNAHFSIEFWRSSTRQLYNFLYIQVS